MMTEYVRIAEAAEYLGVSERTIRRYIADRKLRAYRIAGVRLVFKKSDLDALITDA